MSTSPTDANVVGQLTRVDRLRVVAAHVEEILDVAGGTGQRGGRDGGNVQPQADGAARHVLDSLDVVLGIANHSPVPEALLTDLKLRLDHEQEVGVGSGRCDQRGQHESQ